MTSNVLLGRSHLLLVVLALTLEIVVWAILVACVHHRVLLRAVLLATHLGPAFRLSRALSDLHLWFGSHLILVFMVVKIVLCQGKPSKLIFRHVLQSRLLALTQNTRRVCHSLGLVDLLSMTRPGHAYNILVGLARLTFVELYTILRQVRCTTISLSLG